MDETQQFDVAVIGAAPAGLAAALRAAQLDARTALITRDSVGGMAASTDRWKSMTKCGPSGSDDQIALPVPGTAKIAPG